MGHEPQPATSLRISAIAIGLVVDIVATTIVMLALGFLMGAAAGSPQAAELVMRAPSTQLILAMVGLTCTGLGGYVAGWVAGQREVGHALLLGIGEVLLGLATLALFELWPSDPTWLVVPLVLTVPASCAGGLLN